MNSRLLDYQPDLELTPTPRALRVAPADAGMAAAAELLEVDSAADLRQLLAKLINHAGGRAMPPTLRAALLAALERAAHAALPLTAPAALVDTLAGSGSAALKARAARVFGLELEGLSPEDMEFELARHFVGFANAAIRHVLHNADGDLARAVPAAIAAAARQLAPGLLEDAAHHGRWQRQGTRITVFDC